MSSQQTESRPTHAPRTQSVQSSGITAGLARFAGPWWVLLLTGIAWLIVSMMVLRFTVASAVAVGVLMGFVFLAAGVNEFLIASMWGPWGWLRVLMGALFLGGSIWAFISPLNAFWTLATVLGVLFVLQGTLVLITSIESRPVNSAWWLGAASGFLEILIGFWASQQVVAARAELLILYVGLLALFRGITEMVLAFELKTAQDGSPREARGRAQHA